MEEAGQEPGSKKKCSPHERMTRQPSCGLGGEVGSLVTDVPYDWSHWHAHMETPPRPGQRSRQSKRGRRARMIEEDPAY